MQRKQFIIGAGLGVVATALAACSTYGRQPEAAPQPSPDGTASPGATPGAEVLAKTADIPVGGGVVVGDVVLTQPTAGDYQGFSSTCTHAGCTIREVADGTINCPCHGSKFNLDGSVANGPASRPLPSEPVRVQGDSIVSG